MRKTSARLIALIQQVAKQTAISQENLYAPRL
jgi:hypothetical protein